ncbi:hypothetical protein CBM2585_A160381 [Cupriavidus taiwanensis]|nr:hypothetical protein CBM2585_A160381 [Cupriavidus taiwanensis]
MQRLLVRHQLPRYAADRTRAHGHDHIAGPYGIQDGLRHFFHLLHENRFDLAGHAQRAGQRTAVGGHDRCLAGGIDLGQQQGVDRAQHLDEVFKAIPRAGETVRLERQHQAASGERAARRGQRRGHFHRVMAVVVHQREGAGAVGRSHLAVALEAAANAVELAQRLDDGGIGHFQLGRDGDRRQGVLHVVQAGQVQHDLQRRLGMAVELAQHGKVHLAVDRARIHGADLRVFGKAVAHHRLGHERQDLAHVRVVHAQHRDPVERQPLGEFDERLLEPGEVVPVGVHVVGIDIGDDLDDREQVQERGIRLVGLGHDEIAGAQARVGAGRVQPAADDEGRIEAAFGQHRCHQAGSGGLAVRAGDGHALLQPHQFGQHHRARHHRDALAARGQYFGVVAADGGRHHHRVGAAHVGSVMAVHDGGAQRRQAPRGGVVAHVRARDLVSQVQQDLGDAAHAGAADAHEVDVLDDMLHWIAASLTSVPGQLAAHLGDAPGCLRLGQSARQARHVLQLRPGQAGDGLRQALGRQVVLLHQQGRALAGQKLCVGGLVIIHRVRERHEQRRHARRGHFRHRHRAGAADHQVGVGIGPRHVVDERQGLRRHPRRRVVGAQRVDLLGAGLVRHHRALALRQQRDGLRHHVIQRRGAQAAAHHQDAQRAGAVVVARLGRIQVRQFLAHRVTGPFAAGQRVRECAQHAVGHLRQYLVGQAGDRILLVQHQRPSQQRGHHAGRESDIAAHAQHHARTHPPQRGDALPERAQQVQRQQELGHQSLAAQPAELDELHRNVVLRHQRGFHAGAVAQPDDVPALLAQRMRDRQPGEYMSPGAAGHHEQGARLGHTFPPRINTRFS